MHCHPFQVDEVFRSIVQQLVARSPGSVLSLALCCKSLTDLSLGVLWERQKKLSTLIKVLSPEAWTYQETDSRAGELTILRRISPEEWEKLTKYGSWMRELEFLDDDEEISRDALDMLLRCPHSKLLCPRLLKLSWAADRVFGGDFVPFLSPRLREVHLVSRPGTLFSFAEAISAIPASSLNSLRLSIIGDEAVRDVVVNMLTTCGKNLTTLEVSRMDQLRDSSWCHIMLLPRLHILETDQSPPTMSHHCLSVPFPSLRHITLRGPAAFGWIHYLTEVNVRRVSADTGSQPRRVASRLCRLYCDYGVELDVPFVSHFRVFRNLSTLILGSGCSLTTSCTFHLTDEDVSRFAMELPGLGELSLGSPCPANTCGTTVNSLLALSTYCKGLRMLCIHFNTRNFARDMRESLHNPLRHHSHPPSRCPLVVLNVGLAPLTAEALGEDVFPTLAGLVDIFPGLMRIRFALLSPRASCAWRELSAQIPFFQEMRRSLPAVFIQQTRGPATQNQQPRG